VQVNNPIYCYHKSTKEEDMLPKGTGKISLCHFCGLLLLFFSALFSRRTLLLQMSSLTIRMRKRLKPAHGRFPELPIFTVLIRFTVVTEIPLPGILRRHNQERMKCLCGGHNGPPGAPLFLVAIEDDSGVTTVTVNQRVNGGQWNSQGQFYFESGTTYDVRVTAQPGPSSTSADAVRFVLVSTNSDPTVIIDNRSTKTSSTGTWSVFRGCQFLRC
jgi:hypothetical protein